MAAPAVELSEVSKSYSIYRTPGGRLLELATFNRRSYHQNYWALRNVSFEVQRGETFCIIGENGCGKSTLLQICARILQPSSGSVTVHGRIAALLELGAGFNPEFSGRENAYLNGAILGLTTAEMDRKFPAIAEFAEIGDFIHQPVKTYSSGMVVRLAFAVAINVDPEVLIVDEALAVGDIYFRQRCMRKVHELRAKGVTILFVTHATGEVKALGDRALWLDHGKMMALGNPEHVVSQYLAAMNAKDAQYQTLDVLHHPEHALPPPAEIIETLANVDHRYGNRNAEILGIMICDPTGEQLNQIRPDTSILVRISARAKQYMDRPIIGVTIRDQRGMDLAGANTDLDSSPLPPLTAGQIYTVDFLLEIPTLYSMSLSFSPAIANGTTERHAICDWIDNAAVIEMQRPATPIFGHLRFRCSVQVNSPLTSLPTQQPETKGAATR